MKSTGRLRILLNGPERYNYLTTPFYAAVEREGLREFTRIAAARISIERELPSGWTVEMRDVDLRAGVVSELIARHENGAHLLVQDSEGEAHITVASGYPDLTRETAEALMAWNPATGPETGDHIAVSFTLEGRFRVAERARSSAPSMGLRARHDAGYTLAELFAMCPPAPSTETAQTSPN